MEALPERSGSEMLTEEAETASADVSVERIQVLNLAILVAAVVASLWISLSFALGVAAGGVVMAANFRVIVGLMRRVFLRGARRFTYVGVYWAKFLGIMVLVGGCVVWLQVDVFGFLIGLSTILVAVTVEAGLRLAGK
jgi:hypothetical protein